MDTVGFLSRIQSAPTGCWHWTGARDTQGYGKLNYLGASARAHRVAYELWVGAIPAGLVIDHLCRNTSCVNPSHLEPVTRRENTLRGRTLAAEQVRRVRCPQGHPYDGVNTYLDPRGRRGCRACNRAASARRRVRLKGAAA